MKYTLFLVLGLVLLSQAIHLKKHRGTSRSNSKQIDNWSSLACKNSGTFTCHITFRDDNYDGGAWHAFWDSWTIGDYGFYICKGDTAALDYVGWDLDDDLAKIDYIGGCSGCTITVYEHPSWGGESISWHIPEWGNVASRFENENWKRRISSFKAQCR